MLWGVTEAAALVIEAGVAAPASPVPRLAGADGSAGASAWRFVPGLAGGERRRGMCRPTSAATRVADAAAYVRGILHCKPSQLV